MGVRGATVGVPVRWCQEICQGRLLREVLEGQCYGRCLSECQKGMVGIGKGVAWER